MSLITFSADGFGVPAFCLIFAPSKGYDEPEILPSSTRKICLIGADAGQALSEWRVFGHFASIWLTDLAFVIGHGIPPIFQEITPMLLRPSCSMPFGLLAVGTLNPLKKM
jgi:hypothetical protein